MDFADMVTKTLCLLRTTFVFKALSTMLRLNVVLWAVYKLF